MPAVENYKWRLNQVWHGMLYSCTHTSTVGVKGLTPGSANVKHTPTYAHPNGHHEWKWKTIKLNS